MNPTIILLITIIVGAWFFHVKMNGRADDIRRFKLNFQDEIGCPDADLKFFSAWRWIKFYHFTPSDFGYESFGELHAEAMAALLRYIMRAQMEHMKLLERYEVLVKASASNNSPQALQELDDFVPIVKSSEYKIEDLQSGYSRLKDPVFERRSLWGVLRRFMKGLATPSPS